MTTMWNLGTSIAVVESADRVVLLDLEAVGALPVVLAGTAQSIFRIALRSTDRATLVADVAAHYGVAPPAVRDDVDHFIAHLVTAGYLRQS
ncbi:PqqD family protein [Rathayibacter sp. VKM Ac-2856]|uniref:PqqD family protein n=1 Tax=unclassified Rathayibacter TaxID=2609250 RepID=UPI001566318E|nr:MULTISPECIES: PqqD family protein [unclassified Rathayibacter]NQX03964.1 PqqD family protein [Rathayibacter sp. VKM Ac-2858]NQX19132.1 PqqD family protein [Rathayibacter sp. VKM Ac-2856]